MKHWKSTVAVAALALSSMIGVANAQEPPKHGDHHLQFMATALDLTDAQVAQIKQIRAARESSAKTGHEQMKGLHEQLKALIASDNFDEAKAQSLLAQIQQGQAASMLDHAKEMNAIYKILTPHQNAKAVKMFGSMQNKKGHGGPGPDAPP